MTATEIGTARLLGRYEQGSDEWHDLRTGRLGGSEIAAVLGLSKWQSRYSLWCEKRGEIDRNDSTPNQDRGHYLEPAIAAWWADRNPDYTLHPGGTWVHAERDWQLANPDGIAIGPDGTHGTEWKTDADGTDFGTDGTDEIPVYYRCQLQWYMDCFGWDRMDLALLSSRLEFRQYTVLYDPADATLLRSAGREFLDSIESGDRPDIDAHSATYEAIRKLHPEIADGVDHELTFELASEFTGAQHRLKSAKADEQRARSRLADAMGTAQRARFMDQTIARRQAKSEGRPYVVAAKNLPDLKPVKDAA